jgi:XTP/dITP diphosphohydrolase
LREDLELTAAPSTTPLLIATSNPGKLAEFHALLPSGIALLSLNDVDITLPEETGATFREIADQKALWAARQSGLLALADDSGLEVDALGGLPGVRSARYSGEPPDEARNRRQLLEELAGIPPEKRTARFVCAASLASPAGIVAVARGELRGTIGDRERGLGGFGYDSLFLLPNGRTVAELLDEEKNAVSHRGVAMRKILPGLLAALQTDTDHGSAAS